MLVILEQHSQKNCLILNAHCSNDTTHYIHHKYNTTHTHKVVCRQQIRYVCVPKGTIFNNRNSEVCVLNLSDPAAGWSSD